jgi:hypothetical protein
MCFFIEHSKKLQLQKCEFSLNKQNNVKKDVETSKASEVHQFLDSDQSKIYVAKANQSTENDVKNFFSNFNLTSFSLGLSFCVILVLLSILFNQMPPSPPDHCAPIKKNVSSFLSIQFKLDSP